MLYADIWSRILLLLLSVLVPIVASPLSSAREGDYLTGDGNNWTGVKIAADFGEWIPFVRD